jgi:hypothetical protein
MEIPAFTIIMKQGVTRTRYMENIQWGERLSLDRKLRISMNPSIRPEH